MLPEEELDWALRESDPADLLKLERHRGWLALKVEIYKKIEVEERRLMSEIVRRSGPVDQSRIDEARGMMKAMRWMLTLPERHRAQ